MVLYYVVSTSLRKVTPVTTPIPPAAAAHKIVPVTPFRAYDTENGIGVAAGDVFNATTRRVDLDPPGDYEAAFVNITYARTDGPGFLRTWGTREARPATSSVNAGPPGSAVANAAIVPLDDEGTFIIESASTGRVIVDVMAWIDDSALSDDGRLVTDEPARITDTRVAADTELASGSTNQWSREGDRIDITPEGEVGVPDDGTVGAIVLSVVAIGEPGLTGWAGGFPGGGAWPGNSNVNVAIDDRRANSLIIPSDGSGIYSFQVKNIDDIVVDVIGYITSDSAPTSTSGLYWPMVPARVVDTRVPTGLSPLDALDTESFTVPAVVSAGAVAQNLTLTNTTGPGWLAAHPTDTLPNVSNLNVTAADQTRAVWAFTRLGPDGKERVTSLIDTDLVVDIVGVFAS